ncbi:MAG: ATP-binding protein [Candidatus Aureabacteria bacterium]|nr:ATP-binding protein [Candidatus Auribacterota bacterium]
MSPNKTFLERLIERLDRLDRQEVGDYLLGLAREKGLLENIFNSMQEGLVVIDPFARIAFFNTAAARLLSLPADSLGRPAEEIIADPELKEIVRQGLELPEQSLVRDFQTTQPSPRWIRLSRSSLCDREGQVRGILLLFGDITRQRRADEEAGVSERMDGLAFLTATVAHELGNPLSSLAIHVQLLERSVRNLPAKASASLLLSVAVVKEELNRLDAIIAQFLKALRPAPLQLAEEEMGSLAEEVRDLVAEELKRRGIAIAIERPADPMPGMVDRNAIKQVLLNLIKNSAQAMPRGGAIRLSLRREKTHLVLAVTDEGRGIPTLEMPRIFGPFFSTREGGSGLGLLVVYKIVRQHGGTIEVVSAPARGTVFTVRIPQRPEQIKLLPPVSGQGRD